MSIQMSGPNPFLSILVPSIRPEGLAKFKESLHRNWSHEHSYEVIVDDTSPALSMSWLNEQCYRRSTGEWIMLANDDLEMETPNWDSIIYRATKLFNDPVALIYPNDGLFRESFCCFPIVSRKVYEATEFWPQPYLRYKIDDTLMSIIPDTRKVYMPDLLLKHHNVTTDPDAVGYRFPDGRIYPMDRTAAAHDDAEWRKELPRRIEMRQAVRRLMVSRNVKSAGQHPPGMIGIPVGNSLRTTDILPSMMGLDRPPGTKFYKQDGLGPAHPLNDIAGAFLSDPALEWLFLTNDDNLCPTHAIPTLLGHNKPVVTGLYFSRIQPFEPILLDSITEVEVRNGLSNRMYNKHLMQNGEHGLIPIVACGDGCLLIRRHVLESIPFPWWEYGETYRGACDHDLVFSRKVREAGFQIWCDLDLYVDHVAQFVVRPHRDDDGEWRVHLCQADRKIDLPAAHAAPPVKEGD